MFSDSFRYNALRCSLKTFILRLIPPKDVSFSGSGSQVDPPPTPPGVRGIFSPVGSSGWLFVLLGSPKGSISMSAIFHNTLQKMMNYNNLIENAPFLGLSFESSEET